MPVNRMVLLGLGCLVSCQGPWIDLNPLKTSVVPSENQVWKSSDPISVRFSIPPEKNSAEKAFQVTSSEGPVTGDLRWSGDTLEFYPVPPLVPATRYEVRLSGRVFALDGRSFSVNAYVPFFAVTGDSPGRLVQWSPGSGDGISRSQPLVLTFDGPVDPGNFQVAFSLEPSVVLDIGWSEDHRTVTLSPRDPWPNQTICSWRLAQGPVMAGGMRLAGTYEGSFLVNQDQEAPRILQVVPGQWTNAGWLAPGSDLGTVAETDCLLVTASEPLDLESLGRSFRMTPPTGGHFEPWGSCRYVYRPDRAFARAENYEVYFSSELTDLSGNRMTTPWTASFFPGEPWPAVSEISLVGEGTQVFTRFCLSNEFPVCQLAQEGYPVVVRVVFDRPIDPGTQALAGILSFCHVLSPDDLGPPVLASVAWDGPRTLILAYKNWGPGLFRFEIPGNSLVKESVWLNFAIKAL